MKKSNVPFVGLHAHSGMGSPFDGLGYPKEHMEYAFNNGSTALAQTDHGNMNAMAYQVAGGKIYSGLTRVVWELEDVKAGMGGTLFLTGSHKAHFNYGGPDPYEANIGGSPWEQEMRAAMEDYSCPAGSALIFTESLAHASNEWTNPDNPRCAVFNCYNSLWAQWHKLNLTHEAIAAMPPKRRSLFRGVWQHSGNNEYSEDNRSL